jgi:outer membrane protein assembly factor BamB
MKRINVVLVSLLLVTLLHATAAAANWSRFRGENGSGLSDDSAKTPTEWSETNNLRWSAKLPGPGKSSPIVVGDRVIVTCWSGENPPDDLKRYVVCLDRNSGKELWTKTIEPAVSDEPFRGMFTENGYASHTPASDGERIYAFFGLSGVTAFDMDGKQLWHQSVGQGTDPNGWGSAASPVLYKELVIVNAAAEGTALLALRKDDGKEQWRQEADALRGLWGTPVLVEADGGQQDLAIAVPGEMWGLNPESGKLRWFVQGAPARNLRTSAVASGNIVYTIGEQGGSSMAVRAGGKGDVSATHVVWQNTERGGIGTPVVADGLIYSFNGGVLTCLDAANGEQIYSKRLQAPAAPTVAANQAELPAVVEGFGKPGEFADPATFGPGPGGFGGRGGGMRQQDYSSPVLADGKLYFVRRNGDTYVLGAGREFKQLAVNKFASDDGDFSSTPAVSDGALFIRSSNKLYCVAESASQ